jgi:predicted deacylase
MPPFVVGHLEAAPGSIVSGWVRLKERLPESPASPPTPGVGELPITIIHGTTAGPVLALVAGVHGMEYAPIVALQRLRTAIDPAALSGTVVMVHVANMPSFLGRTIYYSPIDRHNLNRVFPGRADGTVSERIAAAITSEVVGKATHLLDLHGGDGNESLRPYSYWITTGDPRVAEAGRALALAFGLDRFVVDREGPTDPGRSMYLSNTAITRGVPAVTIESGCLGRVDEDAIAIIERGVAGVMKHLGMRRDGPAPIESRSDRPIWVTRNVVLRSSTTGLFYPAVDCGVMVESGQRIGQVTDFHGTVIERVAAPFAGEVLYVVRTPPISAGEPLAMIGAIGATPD